MDFEQYEGREALQTKQGVYTICFVLLCIIDMLMGSATGRVQYVAVNCTGLILGVITLTGYRWRDFLHVPYALWAVCGGIGAYLAITWGWGNKYYPGQWCSGVLVVYLYGFIILRLLFRFLDEKKLPKMNWPFFALWCVMMFGMIFSKNERLWPVLFFFCFGCFYLTDFNKEERSALFRGALNGIIVGFIIVQGIATFYRAYDELRYVGMYCNSNMNALFYLMTHTAILCKWYQMQKEGKAIGWRCFAAVGSAILICYGMLTIGRTAILCMVFDEIVFLCINQYTKQSRRFAILNIVLRLAAVGLTCAIMLPVVFSVCRYVPAHFYTPLTMPTEQELEYKIHESTEIDDPRYMTWERFMELLFGRFGELKDSAEKQAMRGAEKAVDTLFPSIRAYASEEVTALDIPRETKREWGSGESDDTPVLLREEDWNNSYLIRWAIYRTYLGKTNLFGHPGTEDGVWVTSGYYAPHAHNVFLQMLFSHGLLTGILFLLDSVFILFASGRRVLRTRRKEWIFIVPFLYLLAFIGFGLFEVAWNVGQLSLFMFFFTQKILMMNGTNENKFARGDAYENT